MCLNDDIDKMIKNEIKFVVLGQTYFKTQEYNQAVSEFINSSGTNMPADFMIVPSGTADR